MNFAAETTDMGGVAASSPRVLAAFNRRHLGLFVSRFLPTLRAAGNEVTVTPVAFGLNPSEQAELARMRGVAPIFRKETAGHVSRRRLHAFTEVTQSLPAATPVAYWDVGDVVFQGWIEPLWELVRTHSGRLLAAREPQSYPENRATVMWTDGIVDPNMRRAAQEIVFHHPFLNGGFLAGSAGAMLKYFETAASWYNAPKLQGSSDFGDQLAMNVYCHSQPDLWREIPEGWNYTLCGRPRGTCFRNDDGRFVDVRGTPIYVVHGNAGTLGSIPRRRNAV